MANALAQPTSMNAPPAQDPNALAAAAQPAQAAPRKQVTIDQVREVIQKQSAIDRGLQGLLKGNGPVQRKDVTAMAVNLVADRVMSAQEIAGYLATLPEDPIKIREWVKKHAESAERGLNQAMQMIAGQVPPPPDAPGMQPGEMPVGGGIPNSELPAQ